MKKFVETTLSIKSVACMAFAGQIVICSIIHAILGKGALPLGFVWQGIAISVIVALLQYVCLTDTVIKKMRYSARVLLFSIPLLITVSAFAYIFHWFSVDKISSWALFAAINLFIIAALTTAFEIYFRITGKKYMERLEAFRSRQQ